MLVLIPARLRTDADHRSFQDRLQDPQLDASKMLSGENRRMSATIGITTPCSTHKTHTIVTMVNWNKEDERVLRSEVILILRIILWRSRQLRWRKHAVFPVWTLKMTSRRMGLGLGPPANQLFPG